MYGERLYLYFKYMSSMHALVFQRKPCLCFMNRFNFLKHVQHFDAHSYNKRNWKKKKKKFIQFIALRNTYNIMKCFKNQRAHFNELVTSVKARRNEASKTLINFWNYLTHKIIMYGSVKNSLKLSTCTLL